MAKIKLYLDNRRKANPVHHLQIILRVKNQAIHISTGIKLRDTQWNNENLTVLRHPQSDQLTEYIRKLIDIIEDEFLNRQYKDPEWPQTARDGADVITAILAETSQERSALLNLDRSAGDSGNESSLGKTSTRSGESEFQGSMPAKASTKRGKKSDISSVTAARAQSTGSVASKAKQSPRNSFLVMYDRFVATKTNKQTLTMYKATRNKLVGFLGVTGLKNLAFEDVTPMWLKEFDAYMSRTAPSPNGRSPHMRNIRAVFNAAIAEEITISYPFNRFKIAHVNTRKRCLTVDELRTLINYPCEAYIKPYRDMFVLMFMLIGINLVDLANLKQIDNDGRVRYRRSKTSKEYSILVQPEARELIERLHGSDHLVHILDRYTNYRNYNGKINNALKDIGETTYAGRGGKKTVKPLFPELSTYWSRHTWATIAASLDIPKETIAAALGHSDRSVTDIYIKFDESKIDAANRKVLDWVLYGKRD